MTRALRYTPAQPEHCTILREQMREEDRRETALLGGDFMQRLSFGILAGPAFYACTEAGEAVALFGCVPDQDIGVPWLLCTPRIALFPRETLLTGRRLVRQWLTSHALLSNLVHRDNAQAIRFIRALGFTVAPNPVAMKGGEFFMFFLTREEFHHV